MRKLEVRKELDDPIDTWLVVYGHNEIRKCIGKVDGDDGLSGHVEVDETYVGGRANVTGGPARILGKRLFSEW